MSKGVSGTELVRFLSEQGKRIFSVQDARELAVKAGITPNYTAQALHYLTNSGWILRLRRGLYALCPLAPGTAPVHEFEIGVALVRQGAISHWSAMMHHEMTQQIPRRVFVTTTQTVSVSRAASSFERKSGRGGNTGFVVRDTFYQFINVKPERFFGIESCWIGEAKVPITDPERTLLDGFTHPNYCGGFDEVMAAFESYAPKLNIEKIVGYALRLNAAVAKRLGWVLDTLKVQSPHLERLQNVPIKGYRPLNPSSPRTGHHNSRWNLRINLHHTPG